MWGVILGPDNKAIPDGEWDTTEKFVWDVYCQNTKHPSFPYYRVYLVRGKERLEVGHTIFHDGWSAFGSHGFHPVRGFMRRRYAIEYMLEVRGFQKTR